MLSLRAQNSTLMNDTDYDVLFLSIKLQYCEKFSPTQILSTSKFTPTQILSTSNNITAYTLKPKNLFCPEDISQWKLKGVVL